MKIYNTLSRQMEQFEPINPPHVGIYICGPTVYDYTHVGHLRTYINSDLLIRVLKYLDYQPQAVMNITDVGHLTGDRDMGEDKLEKKAQAEEKDIYEIAKFYTDYFFKSIEMVNIQRPDVVCKASEHIQEMIKLVQTLEEKGFTYKTSDGIYFDTSKFPEYTQLSGIKLDELKEGARVEKNPEKKNPTDFALWKFAKAEDKRQMEWSSPWAKHSFPGWHIECSAMSMKYLGDQFDIHTGGIDHINIHHTNEIAQAEAATGKKPFVKYWFHSNHLLVDGQKMSKSLKNFYTLDDVAKKGFKPLALRYLFLQSHYRTQANFTWQALKAAQAAYDKLLEYMASLEKSRSALSVERRTRVDEYNQEFRNLVSDDLKLPQALGLVWQAIKSNIPNTDKRDLILEWDQVLGLNLAKKTIVEKPIKAPKEVQDLIAKREQLRSAAKWQEADQVRLEIEKLGFQLEDQPLGTKVKKA
jgi:cysteinyl-tRNA synthetase